MAILVRNTGQTITTTLPNASAQNGDIVVCYVATAGASATMTGFTKVGEANLSGFYFGAFFYKVAGPSEPANYTITTGGIVEAAFSISLYQADTATPIDGVPNGQTGVVAASITTTVDDSLLIWAGLNVGTPPTNPASMTATVTAGPGSTYSTYVTGARETVAVAGASGTRTGANANVCSMLAIRAGAVAPIVRATVIPGLFLPV